MLKWIKEKIYGERDREIARLRYALIEANRRIQKLEDLRGLLDIHIEENDGRNPVIRVFVEESLPDVSCFDAMGGTVSVDSMVPIKEMRINRFFYSHTDYKPLRRGEDDKRLIDLSTEEAIRLIRKKLKQQMMGE